MKIHKPGERVTKPDAAYLPDPFNRLDVGAKHWDKEPAVRDLLAFVKERKLAARP